MRRVPISECRVATAERVVPGGKLSHRDRTASGDGDDQY